MKGQAEEEEGHGGTMTTSTLSDETHRHADRFDGSRSTLLFSGAADLLKTLAQYNFVQHNIA